MLNFTLISAIVFLVSLFSLINLYLLSKKVDADSVFNNVLKWTNAYILLHSIFVLTIEIVAIEHIWLDRLAPFGLVYGPLLYYAIRAAQGSGVKNGWAAVHLIPFAIAMLVFILLATGVIGAQYRIDFKNHITWINALHMGSYTIWSLTAGRSSFSKTLHDKVLLFVFARTLLLFVTMLNVGLFFSKNIGENTDAILVMRITIYLCMLLSALIIFNYCLNRLISKKNTSTSDIRALPRYDRSSLSESRLKEYHQKLLSEMSAHEFFLDKNLSLTTLAKKLKIPNHHLTQVFNVALQETFYQYVNRLRIEKACWLLQHRIDTNLAQIAEMSGFNSKVSFNRHFKELMHCTPMAYKQQLQQHSC